MQIAPHDDDASLLALGQFEHSERHELFEAFIALCGPYTHGLCPLGRFSNRMRLSDQPKPEPATVVPGVYRHFKLGMYRAFGEFTHIDTGEVFVAYVGLYLGSERLVRPKAMFIEHVVKPEHAYEGPRFTLIRPC